MSQFENIQILAAQVNRELEDLDGKLSLAIEMIRERLNLFGENETSLNLFAVVNNYVLFSQNTKVRIKETLKDFPTDSAPSAEAIQEVGEDLSELLGRVKEANIVIDRIIERLSN